MSVIDGSYLSLEGLTYLWSKLKQKFATASQGAKADSAVQTIKIGNTEQTKTSGIVTLDTYSKSETNSYVDTAISNLDVSAVGSTTSYIYTISQTDGKISASSYTSDSTPTASSTKLVQSGGVKTYVDNAVSALQTAIDGKQDALTIDPIPESGSDNVVRSGGIMNWVYGTTPNTISNGDDLNDYYNPGTYRAATSAIASSLYNCPTSSGFRLEVVSTISAASSGYQIQRLYPNNSEGEFFMRRRLGASSGNWADWYRFAGTVVQPINTPNGTQSISNLANLMESENIDLTNEDTE